MDIFTTQLVKVRQTPIKPSRLKVKGLAKDAQARTLDEEKDHLLGETQSEELHPLLKQAKQDLSQEHNHQGEHDDTNTKPETELVAAEDDQHLLTYEKYPSTSSNKTEEKDDDDKNQPPHLDLFV